MRFLIAILLFFGVSTLFIYLGILIVSYIHTKDYYNVILTFKRFKTLYHADPERWKIQKRKRTIEDIHAYLPVYVEHIVGFPTLIEYFKFKCWYHYTNHKGEGMGEIGPTLELIKAVQKSVEKRAEENQRKIQSSYDEIIQRAETANAKLNNSIIMYATSLDKSQKREP